jgi:hypothetical protein
MFAHPRRNASAIFTMAGALAFGACTDPVQRTDLRPPGPPQVLTVTVMNVQEDDGPFVCSIGCFETATFCKLNDDKRPGLVGLPDFSTSQICDDDLSKGADMVVDAVPTAWFARIEFDRLLDPTVEDLIPILDPDTMQPTGQSTGTIAMTQPVALKCNGVDVPYDGFYDPSGNNVTYPLGPSIRFQPTDLSVIPTGAMCEITIKDVVKGKNGNPIDPDSVGGGGKFQWKLADLTLLGTDPVGDPTAPDIITPDAPLVVTFNGFIDPASITPAKVSIVEANPDCTPVTGGPANVAVIAADQADPTSVDISTSLATAGNAWVDGKNYLVTFVDGSTASDVAGGTGALPGAADLTICFSASSM